MLWRVGSGNRQALHQLLHSLADIFILSSLRNPRPYLSLPLTCLRSFALSRRRARSVPVPRDSDELNTSDGPSQSTRQLPKHQSIAPPSHDLVLEHIRTMRRSRPTATQSSGKNVTNILTNPGLLRAFSDSRTASSLAQQMISTARPHTVLLVLAAAHRCGCRLEREVYEAVARRLAEAREWRLIPPLAHLQKRQLGRHTVRLLDWCIRALVETSRFARLDRALGWFEEEGLSPSRRTYHLLLSGHLRNRNIVKAMAVIQQMSKAGFPIDTRTQATIISAYRTFGPDVVVQTRALDALRDAGAKTSTRILNALLQFSIDAHDIERIISLVRHFDFGTFDVFQLSLGVDPLRREGEDAVLSDLIRSSSCGHASRRILPDIATYTILLHYMASKGDSVSAHSLLEQVERSGLTLDSRFIAALIRLYFAIGRPRAAIGVVSSICADVEGFQAVLERIPLSSGPQEGLHLPRTLPKPTVEILNALAVGLLQLHGIDGLQASLRLMQKCQVNPDDHTKRLLVSHLNAERYTVADVARVAKEFVPNDLSVSSLPRLVAKSLHRRFRSAKRSGWNATPSGKHGPFPTRLPSPLARTSAVGTSFDPTAGVFPVLARQVDGIRPTVQSLADRGVLADHRMFAIRIRHEAVIKMDMDTARKIFQMMLERGLHPNEYHYAALMEGYAATGELAAAEAVMSSAEKGGIRPNCVMRTILIVGYARQKNPEGAMRVLRQMVAAGVRPDVPAIDAITSVFYAIGAYRLARQTLISLWPLVAPLPHNFERASLKILVSHLRNLYDGRVSSKKLSDNERRKFISSLEELFRTWFLTKKSRRDSQHGTLMYVKGHHSSSRIGASQSYQP
ncbi:hypothetical protein F5148DRAFT_341273 [Russula earlei]|uniref:Uncharacterized protein n=1 Tax=Russula earlei TaxID=71964 RepID=A0ACC0U1V6_9AGAM|nr:hypothetical protein F5148DRAFT_341273 [Russula earlei]